jgi:hypothetical protein
MPDSLQAFKEKAIAQFTADITKLVDEIGATLKTQVEAEHTETITATLLGKRKRLAETEEVMADKNMTIEEIRLHNAEVDGWNKSRRQLRKRLLGLDDEEVTDVVAPAPAVEVAPAEAPVEPAPEEPVTP